MKLKRRCFAVAALLASLQLVSAGDIVGKITLKGTPPPERDIPMDPACGKIHPTKKTRFYVVGEGNGLADTLIYVKEGLSGKEFPVPEKPALLDQIGCEYVPYVAAVQAGQKILVRNSDPVLHNVHPTPAVAGNKESNLAQLPKGKDLVFSFDKEELFLRFKCDVHPWMFSYVTVLNHPFAAVSDENGNFKITGLPAGKYTIEARHRKGGTETMEVTVEESGKKEANFSFDAK